MQADKESSSVGLHLLLLIVFIDILSVGLVIPLIPFYAVDLGADEQMIGALSSFYGILQLFGSSLVGHLSDTYGRKLVLAFSIIGAASSYLGMTEATTIMFLFLSRIPVGIFKQTMLISNTIVSDLSNSSDRAKYIGFVSTAASIGYIIGPAAGGFLSDAMGKKFPIYMACILYSFDLFLVIFVMKEPSSLVEEHSTEKIEELPNPRLREKLAAIWCDHRELIYLLFLQFVNSLAHITFYSTFSQFAFISYHLDTSSNGYLLAYQSILEVVVQGLVIGQLAKYIHDFNLVKYSLYALGISALALGLVKEFGMVLVALIPTIFCIGIQNTCITSIITKQVKGESLGTVLGFAGSLSSICRIVSPFIGGLIIKHYGMLGGMALVSSLSIGIALILSCITFKIEPLPLPSPTPDL